MQAKTKGKSTTAQCRKSHTGGEFPSRTSFTSQKFSRYNSTWFFLSSFARARTYPSPPSYHLHSHSQLLITKKKSLFSPEPYGRRLHL